MSTVATGFHRDRPPIYGRERERSGLGALLDEARDGRGSLVLVGGQAGIGKTTLVRDLEQRALGRGMLVLSGYCYDLSVTPPYGPWAQIARLSARTDRLPSPPAALLGEEALTQSVSQQALFQEIESFLVALAEQPLVLILEDLHWADPASLEFLRWFGRQIARLRTLLVITYRDDELTRQHPLYELLPVLVRESSAHRINLRPLDERATRSLVANRYHLPDADEARLAEYLCDRAEGNPFFLGELLRALEEEGRLYPTDDGGWTIANLHRLPVPPFVRQVIDSRLNRLGQDARQTLEVAAVIGQSVPLTLWSSVSDMSDAALSNVIERAVDAHLLDDARDGVTFRFPHALVREALYEGLLLQRKREHHQRVAEALLTSPGIAPDTIAHHLRVAGDPRAIDWFIQAGIRAERVAWLTAADHFKAALELMRAFDTALADRGWLIIRLARLLRFAYHAQTRMYLDEALQYAEALDDPILAAYATFCRGEVRFYQGAGALGMADNATAIAMLRDLSATDRQRLNALIDAGTIVSDVVLTATHAAGLGHLGDTTGARRYADDATNEAEARAIGAPAEAPWAVGLVSALAGDPVAARQAFAVAREQFHTQHDYAMAGSTAFMDLVMAILEYDTDNVAERERIVTEGEGDWNRARGAHGVWSPELIRLPVLAPEGAWSTARDQIAPLRSLQMTMSRKYYLLSLLARIAHGQGDTALAWSVITQILNAGPATPPGDVHFIAGLNLLHTAAALSIDDGDLPAARAWLDTSDRWLDWSGAALGRSENQRLWATWHQASGDTVTARTWAARALETATTPRQPLALLRAHRLIGELETDAGNPSVADDHLQQSLRLAEACRTPYERALTMTALADLRRHSGATDEARRLIDDARTIFTALSATPSLRRLDALEAALSDGHSVTPQHPGGLTSREIEVLRLVASGLTNAQIADRLFVSRRTVDQHLRSIYTKLDVPSRAAATRFAVEHHLV